jgi:hypothetical protein
MTEFLVGAVVGVILTKIWQNSRRAPYVDASRNPPCACTRKRPLGVCVCQQDGLRPRRIFGFLVGLTKVA